MKWLIIILILWFLACGNWLPAASSMDVQLLNWDGTPAGGLQFSGLEESTINEPWVHSHQYLRVIYNSDEVIWGIRIVTDNNTNIGQVYPKPLNKGEIAPGAPDDKWEWENHPEWGGKYKYENGQWLTGNDSVSFAGVIDPLTKDNPDYRAELAWQVFRDPVLEPDPIYKNWQGMWNVGGNWNDDWAYVVDKSNLWNGQPVLGGIFYPGTWNPKYEMIVTGNPVVNYLAQHSVVSGSKENPDPKPGDCDIAVYLAICSGIMKNGNYIGILPAGHYITVLYLELVHE